MSSSTLKLPSSIFSLLPIKPANASRICSGCTRIHHCSNVLLYSCSHEQPPSQQRRGSKLGSVSFKVETSSQLLREEIGINLLWVNGFWQRVFHQPAMMQLWKQSNPNIWPHIQPWCMLKSSCACDLQWSSSLKHVKGWSPVVPRAAFVLWDQTECLQHGEQVC